MGKIAYPILFEENYNLNYDRGIYKKMRDALGERGEALFKLLITEFHSDAVTSSEQIGGLGTNAEQMGAHGTVTERYLRDKEVCA